MVVNYLIQTGSGVLTFLNGHLNTNLDDAVTLTTSARGRLHALG